MYPIFLVSQPQFASMAAPLIEDSEEVEVPTSLKKKEVKAIRYLR